VASSGRGSGTPGSTTGGGGGSASGAGGSIMITEVAMAGATGAVDGDDSSSGFGLVRTSVSGVNESAAMAVQPLLRRRIIRTINRRTTNGTPTAIPRRATDVNGPVGPAGVARSRTSTTHS